MSHFTVMVIGDKVEQQLAPYHEFECTGVDDEYVQSIDRTEEIKQEFAEKKETRLRAQDGSLHNFFDESGNWRPEFSQPVPDAPPFDKNRRTYFVPEGYEKVEVPAQQVSSFTDFVEGWYGWAPVPYGQQPDLSGPHKFGYVELNEAGEVVKCVDRTNPNAKWDWYQIGGRWSGFLKLKPGATGILGHPSVMGSRYADGPGRADIARKIDIDFDGMRDAAGTEAAERWDKATETRNGETWTTWEYMRDVECKGNIDAAREAYHAQPVMKAVAEALENPWGGVDEYLAPREEYIQKFRDGATVCYGLVKDGQWFARGEMGWWGVSTDKVSDADWYRKVNELLDGLPDDTLITIVDCHI